MKDLQVVHIKAIDVMVTGRNPRVALTGIEQLADSIDENGVRNPIKVRPIKVDGKKFELIDGHRRLAACQYLADTRNIHIDIPAMVVEHYKDEVDILVEMMVSNDGEPFTPFEEATLYSRLRDEFKLSNEQIAKRVGKSISHVSDKIALLKADPAVKKAIRDKVITTSDANTIVRKSNSDTKKQRELVERIITEGKEAVIDKELKKGRMAKPLWEMAESAHDQVWTALLDVGLEQAKDCLDAKNILQWLEKASPDQFGLVSLAFGLGQLQIFSNVSNLTIRELWDRLEDRLVGKSTK